ncbi:MAG: hypothetical protein UHW97_05125, partial [Frisingicoccus sp.]|nr:hypothetical protein [Frisingicoccus sp.]
VEISHLLSAKTGEVTEAVERLLKEIGDLKFTMVQMKRDMMAMKASNQQICGEALCVLENDFKGNDLREYANLLSERVPRILALSDGGGEQLRYVLIDQKGQARALGQEMQKLFASRGGGNDQMIQGTLKGEWEAIKGWFESHE